MAFDATNFTNLNGMPPGRAMYGYHTTDHVDVVEAANYVNNLTNDQNLAKGDTINVTQWSATPFAVASTILAKKEMVVTNVIARDAASSPGRVNLAESGVSTSGAISSGT